MHSELLLLSNWRRHREDFYEGDADELIDVFSSAASFAGWTGAYRRRLARLQQPPDVGLEPLPVSSPKTSLLRFDWEWHGLIDPFETPGPLV